MQAGTLGVRRAVQPQTDPSGRLMSQPYVPPGTERFKVKVKVCIIGKTHEDP